jgi:high-affinity iron transporter
MLYSFLITLREGLEAALIIGILMAYLNATGQQKAKGPVLSGAGLALLVSIGGGALIHYLAGGLSGAAMELFEGGMMLLAAGILTWMILWMQKQSRGMKHDLQRQVDAAVATGSVAALAFLSFSVVVREGLETALFLMAGALKSGDSLLYLAGAVAGGLLATGAGCLLYKGSVKLNLRLFFSLSGWLLMIFAAGLMSNAMKELHEAGLVPKIVGHVWDTYHLLPDTTPAGRMLSALFGYDSSPSLVQATVYFGYLAVIGRFVIGSVRPQRAA